MNMGEGYFVGIFSLLENLFRSLAITSRAKKIEKSLIEKYCSKQLFGNNHSFRSALALTGKQKRRIYRELL